MLLCSCLLCLFNVSAPMFTARMIQSCYLTICTRTPRTSFLNYCAKIQTSVYKFLKQRYATRLGVFVWHSVCSRDQPAAHVAAMGMFMNAVNRFGAAELWQCVHELCFRMSSRISPAHMMWLPTETNSFLASVTTACAKRTGAAASVERR